MKIIHKNKKAIFDYEVLATFLAGMILTGAEVKSIRANHLNLKGSYVSMQNGRAFLKKMHVSEYHHDQTGTHEPFRDRELLLSKRELEKISRKLNEQGVSVVPLAIGLERNYLKCEIALARGKKKHDKRESIKERESKRRLNRIIKHS